MSSDYEIKLGEELCVGDKIVFNSQIVTISEHIIGCGIGSLYFGEYIFAQITPFKDDYVESDRAMLFRKCPYIVVKEKNE
jgi:hypothetical protein